jgi:hypothetical protein
MSLHSSTSSNFALSERFLVTFEFVAFAKICRPITGHLEMDTNNSSVILDQWSTGWGFSWCIMKENTDGQGKYLFLPITSGKIKCCYICRQCAYLQIMCEILSKVSKDIQISTGWNFGLCVTDNFNTDLTISSNKHDNRL